MSPGWFRNFGGALSGDTATIGAGPFMRQMFGDTLYEAFREIKRTFDPYAFQSRQDRGRTAMTSKSAFRRGYTTPIPRPVRFTRNMGARRSGRNVGAAWAVPQETFGTMCPSYMATRKETDSITRAAPNVCAAGDGRSNRRRSGLWRRRVYKALDLCLECRACKAEWSGGCRTWRATKAISGDYYCGVMVLRGTRGWLATSPGRPAGQHVRADIQTGSRALR